MPVIEWFFRFLSLYLKNNHIKLFSTMFCFPLHRTIVRCVCLFFVHLERSMQVKQAGPKRRRNLDTHPVNSTKKIA